jgi:hypothetical protein
MNEKTETSDDLSHSDTVRLKTLIDIFECGSSDFEEALFFAQQKYKDPMEAYRHALDEIHQNQ